MVLLYRVLMEIIILIQSQIIMELFRIRYSLWNYVREHNRWVNPTVKMTNQSSLDL